MMNFVNVNYISIEKKSLKKCQASVPVPQTPAPGLPGRAGEEGLVTPTQGPKSMLPPIYLIPPTPSTVWESNTGLYSCLRCTFLSPLHHSWATCQPTCHDGQLWSHLALTSLGS